MARKGLAVWLFSSLTFFSVAHLVEAIYVFISGSPIRLLGLYPMIGEKLSTISPSVYLWITAASSLISWAITCAVAFDNPMEDFLKTVLSDAKKQSATETQAVEQKSELLDAMYETVESSNQTIASVKDMICNVRAEVKGIQPLMSTIDSMKLELSELARDVEGLEEKAKHPYVCLACGKPLLPEFKICPYCGEDARLLRTPVVVLSDRR